MITISGLVVVCPPEGINPKIEDIRVASPKAEFELQILPQSASQL